MINKNANELKRSWANYTKEQLKSTGHVCMALTYLQNIKRAFNKQMIRQSLIMRRYEHCSSYFQLSRIPFVFFTLQDQRIRRTITSMAFCNTAGQKYSRMLQG